MSASVSPHSLPSARTDRRAGAYPCMLDGHQLRQPVPVAPAGEVDGSFGRDARARPQQSALTLRAHIAGSKVPRCNPLAARNPNLFASCPSYCRRINASPFKRPLGSRSLCDSSAERCWQCPVYPHERPKNGYRDRLKRARNGPSALRNTLLASSKHKVTRL